MPTEPVVSMDYESFQCVRDSDFVLRTDGPEISLHLAQVERHPLSESGPGHECFSLLFRTPENVHLQQGTYPLEHPTLGRLDLFLVPLARGLCEAVFNILPTASRGHRAGG